MPDNVVQDVTSESSPESSSTPADTGSSPVISDVKPAGDDRPWVNHKAEMDRKLGQFGQQLADMAALLTQSLRSQPVQPAGQEREYSDEELLDLANAGNKKALELFVDRRSDRKAQERMGQQIQTASVATRLSKLYQLYPVLRSDPSHPLTQAAIAARQALVSSGYPPSYSVDLEAVMTAIADNPALAAEVSGAMVKPRAQEAARQDTVQRQGGVDGATHRRTPKPSEEVKLTSEQLKLAGRMQIKDPAKAIRRFAERQTAGHSAVSLPVAHYLNTLEKTE